MSEFREGDVVRYTPTERFDRWWCREGRAVAQTRNDGTVVLLDTYWGASGDRHVLLDDERATAEVLFNVADYDELPRGSVDTWERYAPADRGVIPSQHGLVRRLLVRKGATEDLPTQIENARERLTEAESELEYAQRRLERRREELAELESLAAVVPQGRGK